jgi:hypothetical protein
LTCRLGGKLFIIFEDTTGCAQSVRYRIIQDIRSRCAPNYLNMWKAESRVDIHVLAKEVVRVNRNSISAGRIGNPVWEKPSYRKVVVNANSRFVCGDLIEDEVRARRVIGRIPHDLNLEGTSEAMIKRKERYEGAGVRRVLQFCISQVVVAANQIIGVFGRCSVVYPGRGLCDGCSGACRNGHEAHEQNGKRESSQAPPCYVQPLNRGFGVQ